jgi:hypothetical protein
VKPFDGLHPFCQLQSVNDATCTASSTGKWLKLPEWSVNIRQLLTLSQGCDHYIMCRMPTVDTIDLHNPVLLKPV